jgi:(p)ppGpp synthase/HD superfamily hydrolase
MLTQRFAQGLELAVRAHDGQVRKGTSIPYIAHPMGVASIALEYGADEDQAIAALLHDAVEDGGAEYEQEIRERFGARVADLVMGCTDGIPDATGQKPPWKQRKEKYLAHLEMATSDVLLVSGSDKLHNARAILADLHTVGVSVFDRFTASKEESLWYYTTLSEIFSRRGIPVAAALADAVAQMHAYREVKAND